MIKRIEYILTLFLLPAFHFGFAQPVSGKEFSNRLQRAAPEFEWISAEAVRDEVIDLLANHRSALSEWAIRIAEQQGLSSGLKAAGLPESLRYLPVVMDITEPVLGNENHRNGDWKMHSSVAAKYGLLINAHIDERVDPELGVMAALSQLSDLWQEFKPGSLAILAFFSSPATVRQIQYRNCDAYSCRSVMSYTDQATLALYHRFLAALYVYSYHKDLIPVQVPAPTDKIPFHALEQAEPLIGYIRWLKADSMTFRKQNPHLFGSLIPLGARVYSKAEKPKKTMDSRQLESYGFERLRANPDSLRAAMRQRQIEPEDWFEFNGIDPEYLLTEASMLLPLSPDPKSPEPLAEEIPMVPTTHEPQKPKYVSKNKWRYYTVRSGDTLWSISNKFNGVTHLEIRKANRMGRSDRIQPGQKLKIPK